MTDFDINKVIHDPDGNELIDNLDDYELVNKFDDKFYNIDTIIFIQKYIRGYLIRRHKQILIPVDPKNIDIDYDDLKKRVLDYIILRKEYYADSKKHNLELDCGFSEWWIAKASNGKRIGEGNCPMDVITKNGLGIDVSCLCVHAGTTNEKSLMQNFTGSGMSLDKLFEDKNVKEAVKLYKNNYYNKISSFIDKYKINKLYYCIFISTQSNVYLSCFKLNILGILNVKGGEMLTSSISIKNFIDAKYGNVILYKAKKRLELRINKDTINFTNTIKLY